MKDRIILIDAHALIHRAYHAMPNLTAKNGVPTGALFGLTNMLYHMILDLKPQNLISCYDLPKATFRHVAFDGYKQNRKKGDEALVDQIISSRKVFEAFGIDMLDAEGYEADDVIGTLVKKLSQENKDKKLDRQIIIVSGDMDTMQMVDGEKVVVYTAKKDTDTGFFYNEDEVFKKYGIYPNQIADYKGLRGDTSDNIPGIKGIGEVTATHLLKKFGTLDNLYKEINAAEKNGKTFRDFEVTDRVFNLLKDGEDDAVFSRTLATINLEAPVEIPKFQKYDFENHKDGVVNLCDEYGFVSINRKILGIKKEVETNGKKFSSAKDKSKDSPEVDMFKDLENPWEEKIFKKCQIAIWLLRSEETTADKDRIIYLTQKQKDSECLDYLETELKKNELFDLYNEMEVPLIGILENMKISGIAVNRDHLQKMLKDYNQKKEKVVSEIYKLAGKEFNLNSPKQLGEILYTYLALGQGKNTKIKKTKGGKLTTNADMLETLKSEHEIIPRILDYREKEKMITTYLEPLLVHSTLDSRIHGTFLQSGTTTGRFSSINPNMQNIPVKGDEGKLLRECFVAPEGKILIAGDYSQIELRVAAMLSGDPYLKYIFDNNLDVHTIIASKMFSVGESEVTKDMRRAAKAMNFGIIYGMGVNSIKNTLEIERAEAQKFYDAYVGTVHTLMDYLKKTIESAKEIGYTETLYKRRRNINELFSSLPFIKAQGERIAMNAPIQGTDADIIKWAMVDFQKVIDQKNWNGKVNLILQIHDELLFEIDKDLEKEVSVELKKVMENVLEIHKPEMEFTKIPLVANIKSGSSWGEM